MNFESGVAHEATQLETEKPSSYLRAPGAPVLRIRTYPKRHRQRRDTAPETLSMPVSEPAYADFFREPREARQGESDRQEPQLRSA